MNMWSDKQREVIRFARTNDFFILINTGAVRTGKTIADNDIFLQELRRIRHYCKQHDILNPQYILAGNSVGSIQRNVIDELTNRYGLRIKLDKFNAFRLMGVKVNCVGTDNAASLETFQGATAFGAYINEGSTAHKTAFDEIMKRCSADVGFVARVIIDTNPDSPVHYLKTDYIDKADGRHIKVFNWTLDDNPYLSTAYVDNIKATTPSGVFYDRKINGLWVSAEGVVYVDFDPNKHYVDSLNGFVFKSYFAGVDWGYEHLGVILLFGVTTNDDVVLIKEISAQHQEIDYWVEQAKSVTAMYGDKVPFYCDTARPEHIVRFRKEGIVARDADKSVLSGIEAVASRIKTGKYFVYRPGVDAYNEEIFTYVWDKNADAPVKKNDNTMDAKRYAIYTHFKRRPPAVARIIHV